ncbi:hypothetical protein [Borrelia sp. RT5S]|nr:hypothetical protein [Borrelia sp. RT5S]
MNRIMFVLTEDDICIDIEILFNYINNIKKACNLRGGHATV